MVDNHAHALARRQPDDPVAFRAHFSEAHDPSLAREHLPSSVQYRWALRQLAALLGLPPEEEALLACRRAQPFPAYARRLADAAHLAWLLLDEGYPPPDAAYSSAEMEGLLGVRVGRMLRLETLLERLIPRHDSFTDLLSAFDAALDEAIRGGYVAFKSIAAYRTGLAIAPVTEAEADTALRAVRAGLGDTFRLASKPIIDFFVWHALAHAARHALPVQFHTGYGDPDLDLRLANPLHLRPLFEDPSLSGAPIVLLHESFPFTAEAAFLAAVYPNAYVDLAFALPPLARGRLEEATRVALGVAPAGKIMCSSDGILIPELYWLGASRARLCLSTVLGEMIAAGELDEPEALTLAQLVLHDNAVRVYRLDRA